MAKSTSKLFKDEIPAEMKEDALNLPEENEVVDVPDEPKDVQDIDLSATKRKRFRINGDNNKILELNTSDLNIATRLSKSYDKLNAYMDEVGAALQDISDDEISEEQQSLIEEQLEKIDTEMKEEMDYIFDAPVSKVCCDGGSMYDPFEGMFRFEHIIDALTKLYENNLNAEFTKMKRRVSAKTSKYTKQYHN